MALINSLRYHGHPVACAAAYAVQQVIKEHDLVENCRKMGEYLGQLLHSRLDSHKNVGNIRGRGLVWGVRPFTQPALLLLVTGHRWLTSEQIELVQDKATKQPFPVSEKIAPTIHATGLIREVGISIIPGGGVADGTNGDLLVISPAYNVNKQDIELIVDRAAKAIEHVLGGGKESKL